MLNKKCSLIFGIAMLSMVSTTMASINLDSGSRLNEQFYVSSGSADAQFTVKSTPTISISGGGMKGGIPSGTAIITKDPNNPVQSQIWAWIPGTVWPSTATISYTATVGSHGDITDTVKLTLDAQGNVINTIDPANEQNARSADGEAVCSVILQAAPSGGYPTFILNCGDAFSVMSNVRKN